MRMNPEFAALEESDGFVAAVQVADNLEGMYWASSNWLRAAQFNVLAAVFANVPEKTEAITLRCMELVLYALRRLQGAGRILDGTAQASRREVPKELEQVVGLLLEDRG